MTVSTPTPARTSAATRSARGPPSVTTVSPGDSSSTRFTAGQLAEHSERRGDVVDLEIDGAGRADELRDRSGRDQPALVHHDGMAADLLDLGEDVAREEHRRPGVGDAVDELAHLAHLAGVEPVRGLVEHEHFGTAEQDACEAQPLAHALGVGLHLPVDGVAETGDGQRALEVGVGELRSAGLPPELEVRHSREMRDERGGLDERPDPAEQRATRPNRLPEEARVAGGGMDQPEQHPERGGLPGAVRAEQSADLALLDAEAEVVDREHALELFREAAYLDDRLAHANTRRGRPMVTP